jgi:CheY-like chemotaxis protein
MLAAGQQIDLLFTDVVMPEMSGRQLADHLLTVKPDLKVLFTTGYTRNAIVHNGVLDSGTQLLPKPFTVDELAAKVRAILDGY